MAEHGRRTPDPTWLRKEQWLTPDLDKVNVRKGCRRRVAVRIPTHTSLTGPLLLTRSRLLHGCAWVRGKCVQNRSQVSEHRPERQNSWRNDYRLVCNCFDSVLFTTVLPCITQKCVESPVKRPVIHKGRSFLRRDSEAISRTHDSRARAAPT